MKVVLLEDVAHVGRKGEITNVADGYGINFLIPNKKALRADSPDAISFLAMKSAHSNEVQKNDQARAADLKELVGQQFTLPVEANDSGTLFGALNETKVAEMIGALVNKDVVNKNIKLVNGPIKEIGEYKVEFIVAGELVGTSMLNVTAVA